MSYAPSLELHVGPYHLYIDGQKFERFKPLYKLVDLHQEHARLECLIRAGFIALAQKASSEPDNDKLIGLFQIIKGCK